MITKEQYVQKHQMEIDALSAAIENLETEINEAEDASEQDDNPIHVTVLRQHRDAAKAKLTEIQAAGDDGWEDFKYGLAHTWIAIKESFAKLISRLRA